MVNEGSNKIKIVLNFLDFKDFNFFFIGIFYLLGKVEYNKGILEKGKY